jgi:hypothetical protein
VCYFLVFRLYFSGVIKSACTPDHYSLFFEWLYPTNLGLILRLIETW